MITMPTITIDWNSRAIYSSAPTRCIVQREIRNNIKRHALSIVLEMESGTMPSFLLSSREERDKDIVHNIFRNHSSYLSEAMNESSTGLPSISDVPENIEEELLTLMSIVRNQLFDTMWDTDAVKLLSSTGIQEFIGDYGIFGSDKATVVWIDESTTTARPNYARELVDLLSKSEYVETSKADDGNLSREEILALVHCYEEMFSMTSEEFQKRWIEGSVPDVYETNSWAILLDTLSLI